MDGDPRVSKPRLPKAYTEEQLAFLRSHIAGFESRTRGHVRGDAKKFALDRAGEFLVRFGLPQDLQGVDEAEPRFREQIYNWYKNTVGRARRKLEGRTRPKKLSDKPSNAGGLTWSPTLATSFGSPDASDAGPSSHPHAHHAHAAPQPPQPQSQPQPSQAQQQPQPQQPAPPAPGQQLQFTFQTAVPVPVQVSALGVTSAALRDAFVTPAIDPGTLSTLVQSYVAAHPSPSGTPLAPVVCALFEAATALLASSVSASASVPGVGSGSGSTAASGSGSGAGPGTGTGVAPNGGANGAGQHARPDVLVALLRRFLDACAFFPGSLVHADVSGPLAGPRALQMALRRSTVWAAIGTGTSTGAGMNMSMSIGMGAGGTGHGSLSDEMERIRADRQRRKEYVQWAQIHAAAIELGIVGGASGPGPGGISAGSPASPVTNGNAYHHRPGQELGYAVPGPGGTLTFSETMARDAVWESDEVEWVAGIIVLRAIIRSAGAGRKGEWEGLLGAYERRWKEIKDEARQALVTEVLLGARDDLAQLDERA